MDDIVSKFELVKEHTADDFVITKYKNSNSYFMLVKITSNIQQSSLDAYTKLHTDYVGRRVTQNNTCIVGYDLSELESFDLQFVDYLVKLHEQFEKEYLQIMKCMFIFVPNALLCNCAKMIMHLPHIKNVIPVLICDTIENLNEEIKEYL